MWQNLQKIKSKKLKREAHQELGSCCSTFCDKQAILKYVKTLEDEIERLHNEYKR